MIIQKAKNEKCYIWQIEAFAVPLTYCPMKSDQLVKSNLS